LLSTQFWNFNIHLHSIKEPKPKCQIAIYLLAQFQPIYSE